MQVGVLVIEEQGLTLEGAESAERVARADVTRRHGTRGAGDGEPAVEVGVAELEVVDDGETDLGCLEALVVLVPPDIADEPRVVDDDLLKAESDGQVVSGLPTDGGLVDLGERRIGDYGTVGDVVPCTSRTRVVVVGGQAEIPAVFELELEIETLPRAGSIPGRSRVVEVVSDDRDHLPLPAMIFFHFLPILLRIFSTCFACFSGSSFTVTVPVARQIIFFSAAS